MGKTKQKNCLIKLNDLLLLAMDSSEEDYEQEMPGVEDETHESPAAGG
jgi:hypothetical protein